MFGQRALQNDYPLRRGIGGVKLPMAMEKGDVIILLKKQAQQTGKAATLA